jgi:3D-(3,5/4)-trihydroxycyclohexane-1,2-dione acylhydrolase (decyclizing)
LATTRLTTAQALIAFLAAQRVERDGVEAPFFAGCLGIFGHGNVAGIGQALQQDGRLRYVLARSEQGMVHTAVAYAKMRNRLSTWACTTSIGPGATNMLTGAAVATVNRLPVLLLPGDVFATRRVDPVLQQLEVPWSRDVSVNDCFRPVSRYWDRINRPEQVVPAALEAMRTLTDPAETGAVTLAFPQDVQAEAWDFPDEFLAPRVWHVARRAPDAQALARAVALVRGSRRPLLVAGGGVLYSDATEALHRLVEATGIPVGETQAGKGSMTWDVPGALGGIGVTGTAASNVVAREADLVIGVGTRWSDFTTASRTAFQHPDVRFVNVNVARPDALKHGGLDLVGDARATLEALAGALGGWRVEDAYREKAARLQAGWAGEVDRIYAGRLPGRGERPAGALPTQGEVLGAIQEASGPRDVIVNAAGSAPGDLHKLWRCRDPKGYHLEYGYSTMGYEVAGAAGVKLADPGREVYAVVGDGSWLMLSSELVTAIEQGVKLNVVLVDNGGFASIGGLSRSLGSEGFGTRYDVRVDFAANAESLGARVVRAETAGDVRDALVEARGQAQTTVVVVACDPEAGVPGFESWWDVPVAEVSTMPAVRDARAAYDAAGARERPLVAPAEEPGG